MTETVALIGCLNLDFKLYPFRDIPNWDREYIVPHMELKSAGSSFNVALPLARLGVIPYLIGCVGNDLWGKKIIDEANSAGIKVAGIDRVSVPTGICTVLIAENGEYFSVSYLGSMSSLNRKKVIDHFDIIKNSGIVVFTGYCFLPGLGYKDTAFLMKKAKQEGKTILFETSWDPNDWQDNTIREVRELMRYVDYFLPSLSEASAISSKDKPEDIAVDLRNCGAQTVIITLGRKGCLAVTSDGTYRAAGFPVKVYDTVGAGDIFNAGIVYGLIQNWEIERTLRFSNALCSIYVSRKTNRYPAIEEVEKKLYSKAARV